MRISFLRRWTVVAYVLTVLVAFAVPKNLIAEEGGDWQDEPICSCYPDPGECHRPLCQHE